MVSDEQIRDLCDNIVREFHPERVILFGSYAYGTPTEDSDVDLLVVLPYEGKGYRMCADIARSTQPAFAVDMLARTPDELRDRLVLGDFFLREIVEKGTVLYAAAHA